jgi:hypothetical protein
MWTQSIDDDEEKEYKNTCKISRMIEDLILEKREASRRKTTIMGHLLIHDSLTIMDGIRSEDPGWSPSFSY